MAQTAKLTKNVNPRFRTFDLLRIIMVVPITMWHVWEFVVGEDIPSQGSDFTHYEFYRNTIGVVFNFSALYVVGISFLLWGLKGISPQKRKILILLLGFVGLQLQDPAQWTSLSAWTWDLYGYLIIGVALCWAMPKRLLVWWVTFILGILFLTISQNAWVPLSAYLDDPIKSILFARVSGIPNGWYMMPWIFVPLSCYAGGRLWNHYSPQWRVSARPVVWLMPVFVMISLVLLLTKPEPVHPVLADYFNQFLFMQSPSHFWNHTLIFLCITAGLLLAEQQRPQWFRWLHWTSYIQWNKNFFLAYLLQFSFIAFAIDYKGWIMEKPFRIDFVWIYVALGVEISLQLFFGSLKLYAIAFRRALGVRSRSLKDG